MTAGVPPVRTRSHEPSFDSSAAFVVVVGTIILWPVLVALIISRKPPE